MPACCLTIDRPAVATVLHPFPFSTNGMLAKVGISLGSHVCRPPPGQAIRRKKPYCPTTVTAACSEPVSCRAASSQTSGVTCPPVCS
jgi:hypothetical protein